MLDKLKNRLSQRDPFDKADMATMLAKEASNNKRHVDPSEETVTTGTIENRAEKVGQVVEKDVVTREIHNVSGPIENAGVAPQQVKLDVGQVQRDSHPVAEIKETETLERDFREVPDEKRQKVDVKVRPDQQTVDTGVVYATDAPVARIMEKTTTERHIEEDPHAPHTHTKNTQSTEVDTGIMRADERKVGQVVDTFTTRRSIVPCSSPVIEVPMERYKQSGESGITGVYTGIVKVTQRIIGVVMETETVHRDIQPVAGASVPLEEEHHPVTVETGVIDKDTGAVAHVVESTIKEQEIEAVHEAPTIIEGKTRKQTVDTGVVKETDTELAAVVETHTKNRQLNSS